MKNWLLSLIGIHRCDNCGGRMKNASPTSEARSLFQCKGRVYDVQAGGMRNCTHMKRLNGRKIKPTYPAPSKRYHVKEDGSVVKLDD